MDLAIKSPTQFELKVECQTALEQLIESKHFFVGRQIRSRQTSTELANIRAGAIQQEATIIGARAGARERYRSLSNLLSQPRVLSAMNKVFDFNKLSDDPTIVLPVIGEVERITHLSEDRQAAHHAIKSWRIIKPARISTTLLTWHSYLKLPSYVNEQLTTSAYFAPLNRIEKNAWENGFCIGFKAGRSQAEQVFTLQVNNLARDYLGMWRFKRLQLKGIVSYPKVIETRLGTVVNNDVVYVDTRDVYISVPAYFNKVNQWPKQSANALK